MSVVTAVRIWLHVRVMAVAVDMARKQVPMTVI